MRTTLVDVNHPERGPIDCDWQIATVARQAVQGFAQKLYIYPNEYVMIMIFKVVASWNQT